MNRVTGILIAIFAVLIVGCVTQAPTLVDNNTVTVPTTVIVQPVETTTLPTTTVLIEAEQPKGDVREYLEGGVVSLNDIKAKDPDSGDKIMYFYEKPFDAEGKWQTNVGDAGTYKTKIVASDGTLNATKELTIVIKPLNRAPVMDFTKEINAKEGDTVELSPKVTDPDGDQVVVSYKGWMASSSYKTGFDDAGSYDVQILASDGKAVTIFNVKVNVANVNRPPVLEPVNYDVIVKEGEKVSLSAKAADADNDSLTITFSKPLESDGTWQTKVGDAGIYNVNITANDGKDTATESAKVVVEALNNKPKIDAPDTLNAKEGDSVHIEAKTSDADGDKVTVSFSGWMTSADYVTNYDDAGSYTVTVSASDGKDTVTKDVKVIVENVNRKPVLSVSPDVKVTEGNPVEVTATATDADNDAVKITFSTPLGSDGKWQTKIGDAGSYNVVVTADDGTDRVSKTVSVVVDPINHAPVLDKIADITAYETDTVKIVPEASDADNDPLTFVYSGWMNSDTKATTYGDAGDYTVKVSVSDGKTSTSQDVKVSVLHKNRSPLFG
jgi:hypothetical protein